LASSGPQVFLHSRVSLRSINASYTDTVPDCICCRYGVLGLFGLLILRTNEYWCTNNLIPALGYASQLLERFSTSVAYESIHFLHPYKQNPRNYGFTEPNSLSLVLVLSLYVSQRRDGSVVPAWLALSRASSLHAWLSNMFGQGGKTMLLQRL